jgi:hypothetical protein
MGPQFEKSAIPIVFLFVGARSWVANHLQW